MALSEFEIIDQFFYRRAHATEDVVIGIGDDAAVLSLPSDSDLVISMDSFVSGVHFRADTPSFDIGYKVLAASLSDLAAMGAEPKWVTMGLTLEEVNEDWLQGFSDGFFQVCDKFNVQLVGGDLTHGPLTMVVEVHGVVPKGLALRRDGAKLGDKIFVTGSLGNAALAVKHINGEIDLPREVVDRVVNRLYRPTPCIKQGIALRGIANAAIDISDGLAADLGHVLERSGVGAKIFVEDVPIDPVLQDFFESEEALQHALSAGDDYQLCFMAVERDWSSFPGDVICIGEIVSAPGLECAYRDGRRLELVKTGYQHF